MPACGLWPWLCTASPATRRRAPAHAHTGDRPHRWARVAGAAPGAGRRRRLPVLYWLAVRAAAPASRGMLCSLGTAPVARERRGCTRGHLGPGGRSVAACVGCPFRRAGLQQGRRAGRRLRTGHLDDHAAARIATLRIAPFAPLPTQDRIAVARTAPGCSPWPPPTLTPTTPSSSPGMTDQRPPSQLFRQARTLHRPCDGRDVRRLIHRDLASSVACTRGRR